MREIKFRAWDKIRKRMGYVTMIDWTTGSMLIRHVDDEESRPKYRDHLEFIMLQYTGIVDKNGKEIYEGDVLTLGDRNYSLHYGLHATWVMSIVPLGNWELGRGPFIFLWQNYSESEVIGNIYENPELLTTKETQQ